jgi:hypothetical protein
MEQASQPLSDRDERASARSIAAASSSHENSPSLAMASASDGPQGILSESDIIRLINTTLSMTLTGHLNSFTESLRQEFGNSSARMNTPVHEPRSTLLMGRQLDSRHQPASSSSTDQISRIDYINHDSDSVRAPYSPFPGDMVAPGPQSVHYRAYRSTPDEVVKTVKALKISGNNGDLIRKIDAFSAALNSVNLLPLLDGRRPPPVQSSGNPNGYSPRRTLIMNDPDSLTEEVDFFFYLHDKKRLFHLVMCLFDDSIHYHCPEDIKNGNGIAVYTKILAKVNGQALRDIDIAQNNLDNFRINPNKPLPAELCRLDEHIVKLDHAQQSDMPDMRKKNILSKLILKDPRQLFHTTVARSNQTYQSFKDDLCHLYDNLPASHQTVKMAAMSDNTPPPPPANKQICYNHLKGKCTKGKGCKYSHDFVEKAPDVKDAPKQGREKNKTPNRPNKGSPKFDYSNIHLPEKIKKVIGAPAGVPAVYNQRGYSNNQKDKIKILLSFYSEEAEIPAWGEPEEFMHSLRMNMTFERQRQD